MVKNRKTFADRIDDFIGVFSPETAARRKYFRFISQKMLGSYRGADISRVRGGWITQGGSPDYDLLPDLSKLRERSRDLVRNDGIASGAIDTIVTNIIGSGIRPQSRIDRETLAIDEEFAGQLQKQMEKIWARWIEYADAGNRLNFYEMEELSERQRLVNGESIIIPMRVTKSMRRRPYTLALQMVESDRLDTPTDLASDKNIRKGVEIGAEYGEPVAYYVRKTHPGDYMYTRNTARTSNTFIRYQALNDFGDPNFFHLYHVKRSGQTRGEPFFAPVINLFKDRFDYMEAEILAAKVAACFAIFIKKNNSYNVSLNRSQPDNGKRVEEIYPAMIEYLNENEEIQSFNPNRPGGTFGLFMERILRDMAAGMNIPYEVLAKDFSKSNYSNTRAALLEARRFFMMQQQFVSSKLCQPVLIMLMEEAYLRGELPILDFYQNRAAYVRTRWISPGWQWVDPQKEVAASVLAVDNNLSTLADEFATQGQDWEEALEQIAREKKKIKELEEANDISMTPSGKPAGADSGDPENDGQDKPADTETQTAQ